ncbi:MAG: Phosphate transporter, periplasmic phosphate-binding protein PstS [Acidobacteriaceae bacterium]|nr:Phosphate transporter, periplasmic phosphate-binding protein PstS [Acidobacteriaceae bacterium]
MQALLLVSILFFSFPLFSQTTRIGGSDTLIYLGQRFAEQYGAKHANSHIFVLGGGTDKSEELDIVQTEGSGATGKHVAFPVAIQSIVLYVNKSNPVRELSIAEVRKIFLGQITNWKELGGPDRKINLFAGESTTGTLAFFQQYILHGEEPYPFEGKSNTHALLEVIAADPAAIGYGTLDANPAVRALKIKSGLTSLAVEPTNANIRSREYPITRHIYWAISPNPSRELKDFCGWALSSEGQLIVEGAGFEPVLPKERSAGLTRLGLKEAPGVMASAR